MKEATGTSYQRRAVSRVATVPQLAHGGEMSSNGNRGKLLVIGGAEDREESCDLLGTFTDLAGGDGASIAVITTASRWPHEVGAEYQEVFERLGAGRVDILDIDSREMAADPAMLERLAEATGVFFTGGNQFRISRLLGGTKADSLLHRRHREEGLLLGGTSAGAAMMSSTMIIGGVPEIALRIGVVEVGPGMEFIGGVIIDQHFEQRGRLRRLLSAVAQHPHQLGLGIDEDTAVLVNGQMFEVLGHNAVTVVDMSELSCTNLAEIKRHEMLALCGVKIHVLPEGYRFDIGERRPIIE